MKCPRCQTQAPDGSKFCPSCGTAMPEPAPVAASSGAARAPRRAGEAADGGTLFGFDLGAAAPAYTSPEDGRGAGQTSAPRRARTAAKQRPAMQPLADFGKPPPPPPPPPVNWTRRAIIGVVSAGVLGGLSYLAYLAGKAGSQYYSGTRELVGRDKTGTRLGR